MNQHNGFRENVSTDEQFDRGSDKHELLDISLEEAIFKGSEVFNAWRREHTEKHVSLRGIDLSGRNLAGMYLFDVDLEGVNLRGANLRGAFLIGSKMLFADCAHADFANAAVELVDFSFSNLKGASFAGAHMARCVFRGANLEDADFSQAEVFLPSSFEGANLSGVRWNNGSVDVTSHSHSMDA